MVTQQTLPGLLGIQQNSSAVPVAMPALARTVLYVEDDDDLREVMTVFLKIDGYKVVACSDAQQASASFRGDSGTVDVLLTDIDMPGKSGIELARELTALRPSLPVLIVSGSWLAAESSQEFESRGWKYISKPARLPAVQTALELLLHSAA